MIDCRSPKYRRKGEMNGRFDWTLLLDFCCYICIVAALGYAVFMGGRYYETVAQQDTVSQATIWKEYKSARIRGH